LKPSAAFIRTQSGPPPGSIHPQGWVPIETRSVRALRIARYSARSIHPQGWVPIETLVDP